MEVVVDTSALLAVLLNEPEKAQIVRLTTGKTLIAPGSVPWEVGNALSGLFKRNRITREQASTVLGYFEKIPIRYVETDLARSVTIAGQARIHAYDAYFIECAKRYNRPLLTLDNGLKAAARKNGARLLMVEEV